MLLRDSLPAALLNLGTLQMLASSHTCTWGLATGGLLNVSFPSIRLPHQAANNAGSQGFRRT